MYTTQNYHKKKKIDCNKKAKPPPENELKSIIEKINNHSSIESNKKNKLNSKSNKNTPAKYNPSLLFSLTGNSIEKKILKYSPSTISKINKNISLSKMYTTQNS